MLTVADLFAGLGGFSEAARIAGLKRVYAANHNPIVVRAHKVNHPEAEHVCQDLRQADWEALPYHDILLASPECQGHSNAGQWARKKSKKTAKRHQDMRVTAMCVIDCVEKCSPHAMVVENVLPFLKWKLLPRWIGCLEDLGYHVQITTLRASHYGVPQRRDRVFVVATKGKAIDIRLEKDASEPAIGPVIEWDAPAKWTPVAKAKPAVRKRIENARARLGTSRFLTQHVTNHPGVPLHEPIRTITKQDHWAVVDGGLYRPLTLRENAVAMGFRPDYHLPTEGGRKAAIEAVGNAVSPPPAARLLERVADQICA